MVSMFGLIIFYLGLLSAQLIYSLMLTDVEGKTYEFGMLRALGFNTNNIVTLIFIQAFTFALPGMVLGLSLAALLNSGMRWSIYNIF